MSALVIDQPAAAAVKDYAALFKDLETGGKVPDASIEIIDGSQALFHAMYLDLGDLEKKVEAAPVRPHVVTVYADVLNLPDNLTWPLAGTALVVIARRIQAGNSVKILLDYRHPPQSARFVLFARELAGSLRAVAVIPGQTAPKLFTIDAPPASPGLMICWDGSAAVMSGLRRAQGLAVPVSDRFTQALDNSFIFASLLVDRDPALALDILSWVKDWSAESKDLLRLFLRSSSLVALLGSQIKARANGAAFVPYLTGAIYTDLATAFVQEAKQYELDYMALNTAKLLTEQNIEQAKASCANAQHQIEYVRRLKEQAQKNYDNACAAVTAVEENLRVRQHAADLAAVDFKVGLEAWERDKIIEGILGILTAAVTFGAAIAAMVFGQEEAAPVAAASVAEAGKAAADAAKAGAKTAKLAAETAARMKELKQIVEALEKLYTFSQAIMTVAKNIKDAESAVASMQSMDVDIGGVDVSASESWEEYRLKTDAAIQQAIEAKVGYAAEYKVAMDAMIICGQSLSAAKVAAVRAGQEYARVLFQEKLAEDQQKELQRYAESLKTGQAPAAAMMQKFYQRYLDAKSSLLAALENYRASYFYWALKPSSVEPSIVDGVDTLGARLATGIKDLTTITADRERALADFDPPPAVLENKQCVITDPGVLEALRKNNTASWPIGPDHKAFLGLDRVRVSTVRVWLEGVTIDHKETLRIDITTSGSYRDRLDGTGYQFTARPLKRIFEYHLEPAGSGQLGAAWHFDSGEWGHIEADGKVSDEVKYAYFEPTPFTEWTIRIGAPGAPFDLSNLSKVTMEFMGSYIAGAGAGKS